MVLKSCFAYADISVMMSAGRHTRSEGYLPANLLRFTIFSAR